MMSAPLAAAQLPQNRPGPGAPPQSEFPPNVADREQDASRPQRMQWWHEARFGMFIHFGLYSVLGHHEWAMENEAIPVKQYEKLAQQLRATARGGHPER